MEINSVNTQNLSDGDRRIGTFLVFAYLFFDYVRPQEYIPGLSVIPIAGVIFLLLRIWGAVHLRVYLFKTPVVIILFIGIVFLLGAVDAVNVSAYRLAIQYITELFPQCIAIYILIDNKERILKLVKWWVIIYFFMALITIRNGGRGPGDFTWDENDAALALSMGIPWCIYSLKYLDLSKKQRYFYWITAFLLVVAIIIGRSRGGFLGLIAVFLILWWFSGKRIRYAFTGILSVIVLGSVLISFLPKGYLDEMASINDTEDSTRLERLHTWEIAWIMYKDNPIIGVGAGNFAYNAGYYQKLIPSWEEGEKSLQGRVTHSLYFQVLADLGTLGVLIYLYIIIILPLKLYKFKNSLMGGTKDERLLKMLSLILISSMGAYAVSGAFISVAYYPHIPIWVTMYAIFRRYADSVMGNSKSINTV